MNVRTKKIIAREFIFLIGSTLLVSLFWLILLARNQFIIYTLEEQNYLFRSLSNQIGDIELFYSPYYKLDDFISATEIPGFKMWNRTEELSDIKNAWSPPSDSEIVLEGLESKQAWTPPPDTGHTLIFDSFELPPPADTTLESGADSEIQVKILFRLLVFLKFPFVNPNASYQNFKQTIFDEEYDEYGVQINKSIDSAIKLEGQQSKELKNIYLFLIGKKIFNREFEAFRSLISERAIIPEEMKLKIKNLDDWRISVKTKIESTKLKPIHSNDEIKSFMMYALSIIFLSTFILRYFVIATIWSVKTLRT